MLSVHFSTLSSVDGAWAKQWRTLLPANTSANHHVGWQPDMDLIREKVSDKATAGFELGSFDIKALRILVHPL
jgi:hypothetical protein